LPILYKENFNNKKLLLKNQKTKILKKNGKRIYSEG